MRETGKTGKSQIHRPAFGFCRFQSFCRCIPGAMRCAQARAKSIPVPAHLSRWRDTAANHLHLHFEGAV